MANYTEDLILETLSSMLDRMPFDKITVTALIKECNISRNTFYYHYEDIYALLDVALTQWLGNYLKSHANDQWQEKLKSLLNFCRENKKKIYHIFNSLSRDQLAHYVFDQTDHSIFKYIQDYARSHHGDPERAEVVGEIISYSLYGYFMRFLWNDMEDDIDKSIDSLAMVFDELLESLTGGDHSKSNEL